MKKVVQRVLLLVLSLVFFAGVAMPLSADMPVPLVIEDMAVPLGYVEVNGHEYLDDLLESGVLFDESDIVFDSVDIMYIEAFRNINNFLEGRTFRTSEDKYEAIQEAIALYLRPISDYLEKNASYANPTGVITPPRFVSREFVFVGRQPHQIPPNAIFYSNFFGSWPAFEYAGILTRGMFTFIPDPPFMDRGTFIAVYSGTLNRTGVGLFSYDGASDYEY
ncbi:MAG: hypothetical protein FWC74_10505 [Candidatus Bathyarchaeota archaeon]|nr:hypothetical protein [Candidatus Termitimicrobium sp.]